MRRGLTIGWRGVANSVQKPGNLRRRARFAAAGLLAAFFAVPVPAVDARERDTILKPQTGDRGPLLIVVSLRKQKLRVFDIGGEIASTRVSSGMPGFATPTGVFSVLEKKPQHFSNIYAGAPMPFMQRLTWSGIALHSGVVPGYRASHGCIRLPHTFARNLFALTRPGVRVIVAQDEAQPAPFSHPALLRPLPEYAPVEIAKAPAPDTRLAANETASEAGSTSEFPTFFGLTPALAAAAADWRSTPDRPRTRAEAQRKAAEKIAAADSDLKKAVASRGAATDGTKAAVRTAELLTARLTAERRKFDPDRRAVRAAEARLADALDAFQSHMRAPVALASTSAEDREGDLEDAILEASAALDKANAGGARGELELAALAAESAAANRARTVALTAMRQAETNIKKAELTLEEATKDAARRMKPVSVLISLKAGRVYVRQGFEAVLEAPIELDGPPRKIGTYVLTAMRFDPRNPDALDWRMVTAQPPAFFERDDRRGRRDGYREPPQQSSAGAILAAALDSITIPEDVLAQISERVRPGASIIVTDRDLKDSENGSNTEFVLLTR